MMKRAASSFLRALSPLILTFPQFLPSQMDSPSHLRMLLVVLPLTIFPRRGGGPALPEEHRAPSARWLRAWGPQGLCPPMVTPAFPFLLKARTFKKRQAIARSLAFPKNLQKGLCPRECRLRTGQLKMGPVLALLSPAQLLFGLN